VTTQSTYRLGVWSRSIFAVLAYLGRVLALGFNPTKLEVALMLDVAVFAISAWALIPGRQEYGPDFGRRFHWTGLFVVIPLLALALTVRDIALLAAAWGL